MCISWTVVVMFLFGKLFLAQLFHPFHCESQIFHGVMFTCLQAVSCLNRLTSQQLKVIKTIKIIQVFCESLHDLLLAT